MEITLTHLLSVGLPVGFGLVGWLTWVSKMLWEIKVDVGERSARQDTTLEDHERRITQLENH